MEGSQLQLCSGSAFPGLYGTVGMLYVLSTCFSHISAVTVDFWWEQGAAFCIPLSLYTVVPTTSIQFTKVLKTIAFLLHLGDGLVMF